MNPLNQQQRRMRLWVMGAWMALLILVIWQQLQQELTFNSVGWALFFSVPLLAPLRGLVRCHRYTHTWATLCVLPYFIVGISESVSNPAIRNWALSLLGCSLLWFFALLGYLRVTPSNQAD